jgi:3',5'-nucleoside bisphosphate phosphatase
MRWYKADMHLHTVLSPCADLDMSPAKIIQQAVRKKLDIIAVTDHNSTRQCRLTCQIGERYGITVLAGAELNTKEEIHCLAFFENTDKADLFQRVIDRNLGMIINKPGVFGHQLIVDEDENILEEENRLLSASLHLGIEELADVVHQLDGIFIPAHVNRQYNGIYSQLGFIPSGLNAEALEITRNHRYAGFLEEHPEICRYCLVTNSDAHSLEQIGVSVTGYYMERPVFEEIRLALKGENGRKVKLL